MAAQVNRSGSVSSRGRQLLALGGGGFTVPEAAALDEFALSLTGATRPFAPHWNERGALLISSGSRGWGAGDDAALHFVDGELREAVGLGPNAAAFRVTPAGMAAALPSREV